MPQISLGNQLYLYQLFSRELGVGKQVLVERYQEVLEQDDIFPEDLDCEDISQLLGELQDFIKLTVFKRGRVYATLQRVSAWDEVLEQHDKAKSEAKVSNQKNGRNQKSSGGAKSWKHKKSKKYPTPAKPKAKHRKEPVTPETLEPVTPETLEPAAPEAVEQAPHAPLDIKLQIKQNLEERELAHEQPEPTPELSSQAPLKTAFDIPISEAPGAASALQRDLPQDFARDIHIKDEILRTLYQLLPYNVDIMTVLDEDWRQSRSVGALDGTRSKISFPLRYLNSEGLPIRITLKRMGKPVAGKRWNLSAIDGDDSNTSSTIEFSMDGAPLDDLGAWHDLQTSRESCIDPVQELSSFAVLGNWDTLLATLATMAAPESWEYPQSGTRVQSRYAMLRDYLALTLYRIKTQHQELIASDNSLLVMNTGLLNAFAQDILACFVPHEGDIAWRFAGFCIAGQGELGQEVLAKFDALPQRAHYVASLTDIQPQPQHLVALDTDAILTHQLTRLPIAFLREQCAANEDAYAALEQLTEQGRQTERQLSRLIKSDPGLNRRIGRALDDACALAIARAQASYRLCTPIYDPTDDTTKLLVPLCLSDDLHTDCALVLAAQESGNYQGSTILSLDRARSLARVVSADLPAWLYSKKNMH